MPAAYHFGVVTIMPGMFAAFSDYGVCSRAVTAGRVRLSFANPRDFTSNRQRSVDDRPYGGGPGMVMMVEPLHRAIQSLKAELGENCPVLALSPQGRRLDQPAVRRFAAASGLILVAGRYEGMDERIYRLGIDEEWSIGDYVLSGGELPAMVLMDAVTRLLPGVLGSPGSADADSFSSLGLDHPHYTRPEEYSGLSVPPVLLAGDHRAIADWRRQEALRRTRERRPDLLPGAEAAADDNDSG